MLDVPFADAVRSILSRDCEEPGIHLLQTLHELSTTYKTMLYNEILRKLFDRAPTDMRRLSALFSADSKYLRPGLLATFIDNHDLSRFASEVAATPDEEDAWRRRLRMALGLLLTWRGLPIITYGTEAGLRGSTEGGNRSPMRFGADPELESHLRELLRLRRSIPALSRGVQVELAADLETYAFLRDAEGTRALTALNNSRRPQKRSYALPAGPGWDGAWDQPLGGGPLLSREGALEAILPPRSASVFTCRFPCAR